MCFHTAQKKVIYPDLKINNNCIDRVSEFNFLGLIISSNLKWNKHIEHISLKISKVIGIMFRMKCILPSGILHTIYNTLIMPHYSYCLLTWGSKIHIGHRLLLLQKKALRMIDDSHYIAHTEPICKKLQIVKISDLFRITVRKSVRPEVRGSTDFDGGAYPPPKTSPSYALTTLIIFRFGRAGRDR